MPMADLGRSAARANGRAAASPSAVPAVALQKFLYHLQQKQWEKAKALAFMSAPEPGLLVSFLPAKLAPTMCVCARARSPHR